MDESARSYLPNQNRTALEPRATAPLLEQSTRKIHHDSLLSDVNLWNECGHKRHFTSGSIQSLNHNPILCRTSDNAPDDADRFAICRNYRASDEILWPPLPWLEGPSVRKIDRELDTFQSLGAIPISDTPQKR